MDLDLACHINVVSPDASSELFTAALDGLRDLGYGRIVMPPLDPASTDTAWLRTQLADRGLSPITIAGQMPGADVSSDDDVERSAGEEALRAMVELTAAIGGDQMNGVPYGLFSKPSGPTSAAAFERAAVSVGRVADYAHERGLTMTFEVLNRYETSAINTAAQAMDFVALSGSDHLRIHLDTFHMVVEEADISAAIRHALPKLGYLELGQSGRGLLSTGSVDVASVVAQAIDDGYQGRWGVEAFSRPIMLDFVADLLSIWRTPYDDGLVLAADAVAVITTGWERSSAAR